VSPRRVPATERLALRRRAAAELPSRLAERAVSLGLTIARVSIRDQRTRWGSCGPNGHITLNWRLVLMPDWVCDYVLVHELMHLRRRDHSAAFWALVATASPQYEDARVWLRVHGPSLH
jgi:predicted metal-dependent hydrolase